MRGPGRKFPAAATQSISLGDVASQFSKGSSAQRPAAEQIVLGLAEQAMHKSELADGPAYSGCRFLPEGAIVVKQSHVGREAFLHPLPKPCGLHRFSKCLLERRHRGHTVTAAAQDQRAAARSVAKTLH